MLFRKQPTVFASPSPLLSGSSSLPVDIATTSGAQAVSRLLGSLRRALSEADHTEQQPTCLQGSTQLASLCGAAPGDDRAIHASALPLPANTTRFMEHDTGRKRPTQLSSCRCPLELHPLLQTLPFRPPPVRPTATQLTPAACCSTFPASSTHQVVSIWPTSTLMTASKPNQHAGRLGSPRPALHGTSTMASRPTLVTRRTSRARLPAKC